MGIFGCVHIFEEIKTETLPSPFQQMEKVGILEVQNLRDYHFCITLVKTWKCKTCGHCKVTEHRSLS